MSVTRDIPTASSNGDGAPPRFRWTKGRVAVAIWLVIMIGFWIYAFFLAPRGSPDILHDKAYAPAAQARCADAVHVIDALPSALSAKSAAERADVLDVANPTLRSMVADLRASVRGDDHDVSLLTLWLADWDQYVSDREAFAAQLRVNPNAAFEVTARKGSQITRAIDAFAIRNKMASCATPSDV